jgi:hypothetical protein
MIVTVGILIALALENAAEALHHRALAREADANIREELRANQERLERNSADARKFTAQIRAVGDLIEHVVEGKNDADTHVTLDLRLASLTSAAWDTAQAMGALGYMSYSGVRRYADAYALQRHYEDAQKQTLRDLGPLLSMMKLFIAKRTSPNRPDVQAMRDRLTAVQASNWLQQGLAEQTTAMYRETLRSR